MALAQRRVLLITIVACVLLAVFAWFVLYQPQLQASQRSTHHIAQVQREIEETEAQIRQIGRLRTRVAELEAAGAEFAARILPRTDLLEMPRQLLTIARAHRVRFLEVTPPGLDTLLEQETAARPVSVVPFYVTVQGRYTDIGRFIESLDRFPYFVRIPDFEIVARQDIRPEVEAKLLVNLFTTSLTQDGI